MNGASRHPALQGVAGVGAFVGLTWPLLVFDRPVYVVISFFVIWSVVIALLFAFSRAPDGPNPETDAGLGSDAPDGALNGGRNARSH